MPADEAWSASSNEVLQLSLVSPGPDGSIKTLSKFLPKFTYPIFGDAEEIFGYKNLIINVRYNATDMRPHLAVTYSKKFSAVGETEATDITGILKNYLPEVAFQKKTDFEKAVKSVRDDWTPPGELLTSFTKQGATYEVWKGSLVDPAVKQLVNRIQFLVPLYIEGGSAIPLDEPEADRWTVFFLYKKEASSQSYIFAGYSTVYRFFYFRPAFPPSPPASPTPAAAAPLRVEDLDLSQLTFDLSNLPCRTRISQFIMLPPFQGKGLGPKLYSLIFGVYVRHPQTVEITVEDPNEAFDDMRDIADLAYLRTLPEFRALRIDTSVEIPKTGLVPNNIVDKDAFEACRRKAKIAPRQFARVLEMDLMDRLPDSVRPDFETAEDEDDEEEGKGKGKENGMKQEKKKKATKEEEHEYKLWRLLLKKRLYKHNRDALGQLEIKERIEKLDETVGSVEFDYARLLLKAEEVKEREEEEAEEEEEGEMEEEKEEEEDDEENDLPKSAKGKRKADNSFEIGEGSVSKKAKVEDAEEEDD
ncbi:acyl-CoA N-acyltransferase [Cladorrhinum samala]|uniref:Histone acetyltransferase type B catalytic subunit n=1 Tax=Cladorrhinum samala TaxID=585594 RepID=A0AAV9HK29_9PEZI|nr:acyl-CoA N-acyltransferase [Cladorrhinum samala]